MNQVWYMGEQSISYDFCEVLEIRIQKGNRAITPTKLWVLTFLRDEGDIGPKGVYRECVPFGDFLI